MPRIRFLLALLCIPLIVGCEGCRRDDENTDETSQTPVEDFTGRQTQVFPAGDNSLGGAIKPGHWVTASQAIKSNKRDVRGELLNRAMVGSVRLQGDQSKAVQGKLPSIRPAVLPKGQLRRFDFRILMPRPLGGDQKRGYLNSQFLSSGRNVYFDTAQQPFNLLAGEQYFFVILTNRPERFARLQVADWVRPLRRDGNFQTERVEGNYQIVVPPTDDLLPLPETMLDWTSTAVVLWDDLSPDALTPQQQTALSDWVRFGGHLIINGAAASERIARTPLADLLPLKPTGNIELDPEAAVQLLRGWSVPEDPTLDNQIAVLESQSGRVAIDGQLSEGAEAVADSGQLVLAKRAGRGRVVQPRFDVTSNWIVDWKSYDSFVNAVLLSRPRRQFVKPSDASGIDDLEQTYPDFDTVGADAGMNTHLHIASRDGVFQGSTASVSRVDPYSVVHAESGIGGWNDQSPAMRLCRQILSEASGIEIPESSLVVRSLGYYLLILVPLNYLVFRIMGRLEYAWLAVPLIAIGGAIWVARAARLDIGFARSQTEVALLEVQADYPRAHLTRVLAIYNSLSSDYDIQFKTVDAAAAPMGNDGGTLFRTDYAEGPQLSNVSVASNTVQMVHAEQIVDLGGPIRLDSSNRLVNDSEFRLVDAVVLRHGQEGQWEVARVAESDRGSAIPLEFGAEEVSQFEGENRDEQNGTGAPLYESLTRVSAVPPGSTRLVGRLQTSVPGMDITPSASQRLSDTIVLVHLKHPTLPTPVGDVNLLPERSNKLTDDDLGGVVEDFSEQQAP